MVAFECYLTFANVEYYCPSYTNIVQSPQHCDPHYGRNDLPTRRHEPKSILRDLIAIDTDTGITNVAGNEIHGKLTQMPSDNRIRQPMRQRGETST